LEGSAREHIETARRTLRLVQSLDADISVEADAGMRVLDVVRELRSAGDLAGIKLGTTEQRLHDELADILDPVLSGNTLSEDVELRIDNDGGIDLADRSRPQG
ncbi:MAG: hypothetical protein ABEJ58_09495, partial [Halodesulfurarchaeum sp.]